MTIILALVLALPGTQPDKYKEPKPEFFIKSESVTYCPVTGEYEFEIRFNDEPDFYTVDEHSRQAYSFQYYVWYGGPFVYKEMPVVVRGGEIYDKGAVAVRAAWVGGSSGPPANGWGTLIYGAQYTQRNRTVSFSVPSSVFDDNTTILYKVFCGVYGGSTGTTENTSTTNPHCRPGKSTVAIHGTTWGDVKRMYQ